MPEGVKEGKRVGVSVLVGGIDVVVVVNVTVMDGSMVKVGVCGSGLTKVGVIVSVGGGVGVSVGTATSPPRVILTESDSLLMSLPSVAMTWMT